MIETKIIERGTKKFEVRVKPPFQLMDEVVKIHRKLSKSIEDEDEREIAMLPVKNMVFKKMVIDPKITDEYLEDEADIDDWNAAMDIFKAVFEDIQARMEDEKKTGVL